MTAAMVDVSLTQKSWARLNSRCFSPVSPSSQSTIRAMRTSHSPHDEHYDRTHHNPPPGCTNATSPPCRTFLTATTPLLPDDTTNFSTLQCDPNRTTLLYLMRQIISGTTFLKKHVQQQCGDNRKLLTLPADLHFRAVAHHSYIAWTTTTKYQNETTTRLAFLLGTSISDDRWRWTPSIWEVQGLCANAMSGGVSALGVGGVNLSRLKLEQRPKKNRVGWGRARRRRSGRTERAVTSCPVTFLVGLPAGAARGRRRRTGAGAWAGRGTEWAFKWACAPGLLAPARRFGSKRKASLPHFHTFFPKPYVASNSLPCQQDAMSSSLVMGPRTCSSHFRQKPCINERGIGWMKIPTDDGIYVVHGNSASEFLFLTN